MKPLTLWVTINPLDYEDPIAQILAGENIDMESFMSFVGPNPKECARNMADDPFASVSFFHFIIETTLECLFAVRTHTTKHPVED